MSDPGPAAVTEVFPSGAVLPENVLRFYVHFSVPMAPHRSVEFVRLEDDTGRVDDAAFMAFKQELWNADRTRLTVLVDPARIKRSIATSRGLGPALIEGRRYSFSVAAGWPAADGGSIAAAFSTSFRVGPALRKRPGVERWTWNSPRPGTTEPFEVMFDRPFDRHLLLHAIHLVSGDGSRIDGAAHVERGETSWSFTPADPWLDDDVHLVVDDGLEDVAGNNLRSVVERTL